MSRNCIIIFEGIMPLKHPYDLLISRYLHILTFRLHNFIIDDSAIALPSEWLRLFSVGTVCLLSTVCGECGAAQGRDAGGG